MHTNDLNQYVDIVEILSSYSTTRSAMFVDGIYCRAMTNPNDGGSCQDHVSSKLAEMFWDQIWMNDLGWKNGRSDWVREVIMPRNEAGLDPHMLRSEPWVVYFANSSRETLMYLLCWCERYRTIRTAGPVPFSIWCTIQSVPIITNDMISLPISFSSVYL